MRRILHKTDKMKTIENKECMSIEEKLRRLFVDENKSIEIIADELSISYVTACKWIDMAGIHSRKLKL